MDPATPPPVVAPPTDAPARPARSPRRLLSLGGGAATLVLCFVLAIDVWATLATDPDYYLPDLFRPLSIALVALFFASGLVAWRGARRSLRALFFLVTASILLLEARARYGDTAGDQRIIVSPDPLLRYGYKPGEPSSERLPDGSQLPVSSLGFIDLERAMPKPAGVYRVVVLTGSIGNDEHIPFDDRFWRVLERELATSAPSGKRIEVANVSCDGYSQVQQVRLLEKVGLKLEPDLVVAAYMLSSASLQNGAYRRFGNSFFLFRFIPLIKKSWTGSMCSLFQPFHESYAFHLIVRNSLERLRLLSRLHHFEVLVAVLPVVERAEDPVCAKLYDQVLGVAREVGFPTVRVADDFKGLPVSTFAKPHQELDVCHPNSEGHRRIGVAIAAGVRRLLAAPAP